MSALHTEQHTSHVFHPDNSASDSEKRDCDQRICYNAAQGGVSLTMLSTWRICNLQSKICNLKSA